MKKLAMILLALVCICACAVASAQTFTFEDIYATLTLDENAYTFLTPDNLDLHPEWVADQGVDAEALSEQWREEGILLTAVSLKDKAVRVVVSAVQDDFSTRFFDADQVTAARRSEYRLSHSNNEMLQEEGFTFQSVDWQNLKHAGRFLVIKYRRTVDDVKQYGYARRTVRNGYTIMIDYQVHGRALKTADATALTRIMENFSFTQVLDKPVTAVPRAVLEKTPPAETNTGKFTVSGKCEPGLTVTGIVLRMSSPDPIRIDETATNSGKFSLDVKLPEEGVWLMSLTFANQGEVVDEYVFGVTTYQKNLLPVNFTNDFPTVSYDDQLVVSGTTLGGVQVQCLAGLSYEKRITTNNSGKFTFKIDTKDAGEYDITLVFTKKGMNTRRYVHTVNRIVTEDQQLERWRKEAVKPAYKVLTSKLTGYTGRVMGYNLYVVGYELDGDAWRIRMAMKKVGKNYDQIVYVRTADEPQFEIGTQQKVYARCGGSIEIPQENGSTKAYPVFDLLFWD